MKYLGMTLMGSRSSVKSCWWREIQQTHELHGRGLLGSKTRGTRGKGGASDLRGHGLGALQVANERGCRLVPPGFVGEDATHDVDSACAEHAAHGVDFWARGAWQMSQRSVQREGGRRATLQAAECGSRRGSVSTGVLATGKE